MSTARRLLSTLCAALFLITVAIGEPRTVYDIDLPAQSLADALNGLSEQTGIAVIFSYDLVKSQNANAVRGRYTLMEAVDALLEDTGLSGGLSDKGVLSISPAKSHAHTLGETTLTPNDNARSSNENGRDNAHSSTRRVGIAGLFATLAAAFSVSAEESNGVAAESTQLAEVVVTARLREERLQDVPASIVAATGQKLSDLNVVSITELGTVAPGLTFVTDPGRFGTGPAIAIRGISTLTQSPAIQDSVGTVIDGIPISRAKAGAFPDLNDVSQVEILRGPQGTLFGKNATAGVISITTKEPTKAFSADADVDYSTHNDAIARVAVSGPLGAEDLLGRISLYGKTRDGYITNVYDGSKWDDDRQRGARAKIEYTPTPDDTIKLSGDFLRQNNDAGQQTVREFLPTTAQYVRTLLGPIVRTDNDEVDAQSLGSNTQRVGGAALQWEHAFRGYTLTAIGGYRDWTQDSDSGSYNWLTPLNGGPGNGGNTIFDVDAHQYSGELRIASPTDRRIDYVGGLFVFNDEISTLLFDPLPGLLALSPTGEAASRQQRNWTNDTRTLNYAAFGEANAHVTDQLTLTAGLRWTHERVEATVDGLPTSPGLARLVVPLGLIEDSRTASNLSWRAGSQWRFAPDQMFYVSGATGFKGPGFNVVTSIPGNAQPVSPETSTSFEAGLKSQFLDRRLTADLDVFHAIYRDYQTQGFVFVPSTNVSTVEIKNAGKLQTQGVEADLVARVAGHTEISANGTFIDAIFKQFDNAQCYAGQPVGPGECSAAGAQGEQNLSGKRLANTPRWAYNILVKQDFRVPVTGADGFATLDYSWRSAVQWDATENPLGIEKAYGLLGASLGMTSLGGHFGVKLYGKNLTSQFHTEGFLIGQTVTQFLPVDYKRVLGVDLSYRY